MSSRGGRGSDDDDDDDYGGGFGWGGGGAGGGRGRGSSSNRNRNRDADADADDGEEWADDPAFADALRARKEARKKAAPGSAFECLLRQLRSYAQCESDVASATWDDDVAGLDRGFRGGDDLPTRGEVLDACWPMRPAVGLVALITDRIGRKEEGGSLRDVRRALSFLCRALGSTEQTRLLIHGNSGAEEAWDDPPIDRAANALRSDIVRAFVGADPAPYLDQRSGDQQSMLLGAAAFGNGDDGRPEPAPFERVAATVDALLELGCDPNGGDGPPLHEACGRLSRPGIMRGDVMRTFEEADDAVRALLWGAKGKTAAADPAAAARTRGFDLEKRDRYGGVTPLMVAMDSRRTAAARMLLEAGASAASVVAGKTASAASSSRHDEETEGWSAADFGVRALEPGSAPRIAWLDQDEEEDLAGEDRAAAVAARKAEFEGLVAELVRRGAGVKEEMLQKAPAGLKARLVQARAGGGGGGGAGAGAGGAAGSG